MRSAPGGPGIFRRAGPPAPRAASAPRCRRRAASGSRSATASSTRSTIRASTRPARAISASSSPTATAISPKRSATPTIASPRRGWRAGLRLINTATTAATASKRVSCPIRSAMSCCSDPVRAAVRRATTIACTRCWRRIWSIAARSNTAWVGDYKGHADAVRRGRRHRARAGLLGAVARAVRRLRRRQRRLAGRSAATVELTGSYDRAENGNVALTGEIDFAAGDGEFVLALGFGRIGRGGASRPPSLATASTPHSTNTSRHGAPGSTRCCRSTAIAATGATPTASAPPCCGRTSALFPGGIIASLSIPWGFTKGDEDLGGYHLVWPRDLVETAGGAARLRRAARRRGACCTICGRCRRPTATGRRICWLDGAPYWGGVQMDECAFPILLVDLARREGVLTADRPAAFWPMVRAGGRLRHAQRAGHRPGPLGGGWRLFALHARGRDRGACSRRPIWPTLRGDAAQGRFLRETADTWNDADRELDLCATGTDAGETASASTAIMSASRRRPGRRRRDLMRSRTAPVEAMQPAAEWSAPMRWRWCASACARRTIRASATRCGSSTPC